MAKHMKHRKVNFVKYYNKLAALVCIMAGVVGITVLDDVTPLVCSMFIAVPLLFTKKNVYY